VTFDELMTDDGRMVFRVNREVHPDVTPLVARVGETQVWDLVNESGMDHPFHLHGFFFQVLARNGAPEADVSWEDTTILRGHERVRIAFRPESRPGVWMFHCHILEHGANGMMGRLVVEDPAQPTRRPEDPAQAHH
jgi:FtsP/CotA-like multicopper oxidase with cupredoxin domain